MASPVRLAYRSREAGEGGDRCPRTPSPTTPIRRVGRFVPPPRDRPTGPARERDRRSADRRPRSGAAGARGRDRLSRRRVRGAVCGRWRPRRQHQPDRLPGGLHGPLVRRPGRRHDVSADRQLRPARRGRPVDPAVAARRWSSPMPRPPCSRMPASWRRCCATTASRRSPASTRARSPATCAANGCLRGIVTAPGEIDPRQPSRRPAPSPRWEDQDFVGAGLAAGGHRRRGARRRRTAHRDRRPRAEVQHRPGDAPSRGAGPRVPAHGRRVGRPRRPTSTG